MTDQDSEDLFAPDPDQSLAEAMAGPPWKVLVVDDDRDVVVVTRLTLQDLRFRGRDIQFFSAATGAEARAILREEADIALVLLDVVMETDGAGLQLVRYIREELGNQAIRVFLRTGHPGQAPERHVVLDYDIDGYTAKIELTAKRLFTAVVSSLRTYDVLRSLDRHRRGLEEIVRRTDELLHLRTLDAAIARVVEVMPELLGLGEDGLVLVPDGAGVHHVRLAVGRSTPQLGMSIADLNLPTLQAHELERAVRERRSRFGRNQALIVIPVDAGRDTVVRVPLDRTLDSVELALLKVFASKITACCQAVHQAERLAHTNRELVELTASLERRVVERTTELERLAMIDPLTEVANRRHFYGRAAQEMVTARLRCLMLSVVLFDLDKFKRINDTYGHVTGDIALRNSAAVCAGTLRGADLLGRFGGEEFAVLLPGVGLRQAVHVAERMRTALASSRIEEIPDGITASFGVATLEPGDETIDALLGRADRALYRAKEAGRNRVAVATLDEPPMIRTSLD